MFKRHEKTVKGFAGYKIFLQNGLSKLTGRKGFDILTNNGFSPSKTKYKGHHINDNRFVLKAGEKI